MRYPPLNELAMALVKKILPYGAIVSLEEYDNADAFVHISEVSTAWTRNVSDHVKEGQKVVVKVIRIDPEKRQIDVSLKRVSEGERRQKAGAYKAAKRASKLFERAAFKAGVPLPEALKEVAEPLAAEYGSLYAAFEALSQGEKPKAKLAKKWLDALSEIAETEIKKKEVEVRATLRLKFYGGGGLSRLKAALAAVRKDAGLEAHYVSAGNYMLKAVAGDYKTAEKALDKAEAVVAAVAGRDAQAEYSLERKKK